MTVSLAREREWPCSNCGTSTRTVTWLAVDVVERPDLRALLSDGSLARVSCSTCETGIERVEPMLVTRLGELASALLAVPDEQVELGKPPEAFIPVIDEVRDSLGDGLRDIPGPLILIPFDVLALAASRDVDADAGDLPATIEALSHHQSELSERYASFLMKIRGAESERRTGLALNCLRVVENRDQLERLAEEFAELSSAQAFEKLSDEIERAPDDEARHVAKSRLRLVEALAAGDVDGGWAGYEAAMLELGERFLAPRLDQLTGEFDRLRDAGDWLRAVEVGQEILTMVRLGGMDEAELVYSDMVAEALHRVPGKGQDQRLEDEIVLRERALEILATHPELAEPADRAHLLVNLGAAYGGRLRHDPSVNQERAIACQREALRWLTMDRDRDLWAMAHTNLGLGLLNRFLHAGDEEDIAEAIDHLETALQWRSLDRDPVDWAYTEINLGIAFSRRPSGRRRENLLEANAHYERAVQGLLAVDEPALRAQALHNLSRGKLDLAQLEDTGKEERAALLVEAKTSARASLETRDLDMAPVEAGRTWSLYGDVLNALGERTASMEAYRHALEGLTPLTEPRECRDAARSLGWMAAEAGDWPLAATAWETAADAAAAALDARATGQGRFEEVRHNLNVFRWAAYALARAGKLERAVEVIELGRARQLAGWIHRDAVGLEELGLLDPALRERFLALRSRLDQVDQAHWAGREPAPDIDAGLTAEEFRATIESIRRLPGFERFLAHPTLAEIGAAPRPGEPIAYLVTSPNGSVALLVWIDGQRHAVPRVDLVDVPELTSTEIVPLLFKLEEETTSVGGYVAAQAGETDDLDVFLGELGSVIGQRLLKPLAQALRNGGASAVCLVPVTLMGLLPLHALQWEEPNGNQCLIDEFDVIFAPSAGIRSACLRRAALRREHKQKLVAVGNPLPHTNPLPGAEFEVDMVASTLHAEKVEVLRGTQATKQEVISALTDASHVHLACHGYTNAMGEVLTAGLSLAREEGFFAHEIIDLHGFAPRLVVASACQTGIVQGYETADEALGLATVFLGAGAAGVVATLWPVDDYATALLMCRFYEVMAGDRSKDEIEPAAALRRAQLWLRDLTASAEEAYVQARPILRAHRRSAAARRTGTPGPPESIDRPHSALSLWAPFVFTGA